MKTTLLLASALGASAFPHLKRGGEDLELMLRDLYHNEGKRGLMTRDDYLGISRAESNCGTRACPTFDPKDQLVSVSGEHVWAAPGPGDIRGPCPGLNAAANHGENLQEHQIGTVADR